MQEHAFTFSIICLHGKQIARTDTLLSNLVGRIFTDVARSATNKFYKHLPHPVEKECLKSFTGS